MKLLEMKTTNGLEEVALESTCAMLATQESHLKSERFK